MTKHRLYGIIIVALISLRISTCRRQERKGKLTIDWCVGGAGQKIDDVKHDGWGGIWRKVNILTKM